MHNDAEKQTAIQQEYKQKIIAKVELEELQRYSQNKAKELVVLQASLEGEKEKLEARINAAKAAAAQQLRDAQTEDDRQIAEEKKIAARKAGDLQNQIEATATEINALKSEKDTCATQIENLTKQLDIARKFLHKFQN